MSAGIQPGTFLGPYQIRDTLGSGALGIVYRARQPSLERDVALKVLSAALALNPDLVERFQREARTAAALRHPNIVTIYDTGGAEGCHYIAMELLAGCTLDRLPLPLEPLAAADVVRQLAEALSYAHRQGVVHRDLKPENVLIDESRHVTLTDFGIARVVGQASLTLGGGPVGTPEFMAPEQARGESADARSDVYSLGLLFYFLLTGRSPFRAENALATMYRQIHEPLPTVPPGIPTSLRRWIERCAVKDAEQRFTSGTEALSALKDAVALCPPAGSSPDLNPLDAILKGEMSLAEALAMHQEREAEIRSAFQREVTALSLDVVRSSLLKAPGQTIIASYTFGALRRYVQEIVDRRGSVASAWSGDGLMALFHSADEATRTAAEILAALPGFNQSQSGLQELVHVRIGLHTGRVLMVDGQRLGEITSPTLDLAGRLQKEAGSDHVLASEATYLRLTERHGWQLQPSVLGVPVPVYGSGDGQGAAGGLGLVPDRSAILPDGQPSLLPGPVPPTLPPVPLISSLSGSSTAGGSTPMVAAPSTSTLIHAGHSSGRAAHSQHLVNAETAQTDAQHAVASSGANTSAVWSVPAWTALTVAALAASLIGLHTPHVALLWIASILWASVLRRHDFRLWGLALTIAILGLLLSPVHNIEPMLAMLVPITLAVGVAGVAEGTRQRRRRARWGRVVLEPPGPGVPPLPPAIRERLMDEMSNLSRRLGYDDRQLGLRAVSSVEGHLLSLSAEAYDRDTNTPIARAEVRGDINDAEGLASDLARRLGSQLSGQGDSRALPPGYDPARHRTRRQRRR